MLFGVRAFANFIKGTCLVFLSSHRHRLIKNGDDVRSQCQYLTQSYAAIFISSTTLTKGATYPLRGLLLKMKINEWGRVEVNIQSRSVCGLICIEHGVLCWSETAVEGSSSSSYCEHPLFHLLPLLYLPSKKLQTE